MRWHVRARKLRVRRWARKLSRGTRRPVCSLGYVLRSQRPTVSAPTLMAKAGYDPATAVSFWERMSRAAGDKPPEFLSTYPSDTTRVNQIKEWLPQARVNFRGK